MADSHAVIYPYYEDVLRFDRSSGKLLPLGVAKQAIQALRRVYDAGFALIDAHPENILVDRREGLKLMDFEFIYSYGRKPSSFERSYDIGGCPDDFDGDLPIGGPTSYARDWQPYVGLSLDSLLHDPAWLQHLKRFVHYLVYSPRFLPKRMRYYYRRSRQRFEALLSGRTAGQLDQPSLRPATLAVGQAGLVGETQRDAGRSGRSLGPVDRQSADAALQSDEVDRTSRAA
jgi:hypothetical protein